MRALSYLMHINLFCLVFDYWSIHLFLNWYLLPLFCMMFSCIIIRELQKRQQYSNLQTRKVEGRGGIEGEREREIEGERYIFWLLLFKNVHVYKCVFDLYTVLSSVVLKTAAFSCGYELESNFLTCYIVKTRHHASCFSYLLVKMESGRQEHLSNPDNCSIYFQYMFVIIFTLMSSL